MRSIETLIGYISGLSIMTSFSLLKVQHFKHHRFTNNPHKDPDYDMASSTLPMAIIRSLGVFFIAYYNVYKFKALKEKGVFLSTTIYSIIVFTSFLSLGISYGWRYPVFLWLLPALIALLILSIIFAWLPHRPHKEQSKYKSSRIILGPVWDLICLYQNYHLIHHLYPKIPFYKDKDAFKNLESELLENVADIK